MSPTIQRESNRIFIEGAFAADRITFGPSGVSDFSMVVKSDGAEVSILMDKWNLVQLIAAAAEALQAPGGGF